MKKYTLTITASCFGSIETFYKMFAKDNRYLYIEDVEFENTNEQHNSGYIIEDFETDNLELFMINYLKNNENLLIEYFSVREKGQDMVILTEDDL